MNTIHDIHFSLKSMMDDFGRVFFTRGKVFREIYPNKESYCLSLLSSDLFKELHANGYIPETSVSNQFPNTKLVLEHERLQEILQHEWTFSMLKDASLTLLHINEICRKHGYELKDAHTMNVLFRGTKPVLVDIGSIDHKTENSKWPAYDEFLSSFVVPLLFWSENRTFIVRKLLESNFHKITTLPAQSIKDSGLLQLLEIIKQPYRFQIRSKVLLKSRHRSGLLSLLSAKITSGIRNLTRKNTTVFTYQHDVERINYLEELFPQTTIREFIHSLPDPTGESMWQNYHHNFYNKDGNINFSARFERILEIICSVGPIDSVIDLAGNEGYFSRLVDTRLHPGKIIVADYDENAINTAFNFFKSGASKNVHTVLLNFMFTPDLAGTTKRLQCDLAVALAVTHHLLLTAKFSLDAIFERIRMYSRKYVLIEFMPLGLWASGDTVYPTLPEWYNLDWFRSNFEKYFEIITEEQTEENRILFFGRLLP